MATRNYFRFLIILAGSVLFSACMKTSLQPTQLPLLTPPAMVVYITDVSCPSMEVQPGYTVDWINNGKKDHVVQSEPNEDGGRFPNSDVLHPGDGYSVTFSQPGTIPYNCSKDGSLQGTINVAGPTPQPASITPQLGSGVAHSCLLTGQGQIFCWGQGAHTGEEIRIEELGKPFLMEGSDAISLGSGWYHTCIATRVGDVKCWGQNTNGQLGDGTLKDSPSPVDVANLEGVTFVAAGVMHTCALTASGGVYCWGANAQGQLGDGTTTDRSKPVQVNGLHGPAASIAAGLSYTCATLVSGQVECWGDYDFINGEQRHRIRTSPESIPNLNGYVEKIGAGDYHICVLTKSKEVKCEGFFYPPNGQPFSKPVEILGELQGHIQDILAETDFTCVAADSGKVYCWGDNYFDQIGDGTFLTAGEPKQVSRAGDKVIALGGGHYTACALRSDGSVICWGDTSFGQLGDGTARWKE